MTTDFKISIYLKDAIDNVNHNDLAMLWTDITIEKIYCTAIENMQLFYKFNKISLIYEQIGSTQFTEIIRTELINYLKKVKIVNTDDRLTKLLKSVGGASFSSSIAEIASNKIYDPSFYSKLDRQKDMINFANGYVNLRTGTFKKRDPTDFFSKCLDYDYIETAVPEYTKKIQTLVTNICNDERVYYDFMLGWLGYCLTGETSEQKSLYIIGHSAENGKSTLSKIFEACFTCYCFKFHSDSLCEKNDKSHKYIASTKGIRYVYIEELGKGKLNESLYKDLVDGNSINNEVLFKTTEKIEILFKINIISNNDPVFNNDAGMKRRGLLMNFTNSFKEDDDYRPGVKGLYKKDKKLLNLFENNEYKIAFFHILLPYAIKFYKTELFIPKCMKDQFKDLCGENDKMSAFIDNKIELTGHIGDKMYKDQFLLLYNTHYNLHCNWMTILSDIKRCGLNYDRAGYCVYGGMSQRGVITGIRARNVFNKDLDFGDVKQICLEDFKEDYEQKYNDLLEKYNALELLVRPVTPPEPIVVTYDDDVSVLSEVITNTIDELVRPVTPPEPIVVTYDDVDIVSVLTEQSLDSIDIYREKFGKEFDKLDKYQSNIKKINNKLLRVDDLQKTQELQTRLKENKAKIDVILANFDEHVRSTIFEKYNF